jgi:hypothetical protein
MRQVLTFIIVLFSPIAIAKQGNPLPVVQQKMKALEWLSGSWEGTAYLNGKGENRQAVKHHLEFAKQLNGTVFYRTEKAMLGQDVLFQNIGFLGYDFLQSRYTLHAFTNGGEQLDAYVEVLDNKMVWRSHAAGNIYKYTAYLNDKGQWHQVGEVTTDEGKSWQPFLESILNRVD